MKLIIILAGLFGIQLGVGTFTFYYGKGYSYMTDNPKACANCHIMTDQYDSWNKSTHHKVAVCNDCHTPHNFLGKYSTKAINGFNHSLAFTTQHYPQEIVIKAKSREIVELQCRYCHQTLWEAPSIPAHANENMSCLHCHNSVGHAR